ncbi:MAG TPA: sigma-70 family RNA polymerase sigma factor [Acidimicrobiales bacterium]|nr:sigma-70 family RNA polymerase sigma factor [Acidimicrobiales bacterium]
MSSRLGSRPVSVGEDLLERAPVASARMTVPMDPMAELEPFRRQLTGFCYRMLGSGSEAEDAVQETMLRAWRAADGFEGRASVRSWLYRIATNVCIDMSRSVQRRARPMEMGPASRPDESLLGAPLSESTWVTPIPDDRLDPVGSDPAQVAERRESIRLAFVAALQHLPPRQRAALILCEVLRWRASEVAELLDVSVAAVNSALQRSRATLATLPPDPTAHVTLDDDASDLLARFVDAFERYDIPQLVTLLREDVVMSMPPFAMWLRGAENVGRFMLEPTPSLCRDSRLLPLTANGCPAFAQFKPDPAGGRSPWGIQVLEVSDGRIAGFHCFLGPELFAFFGLPDHLAA